MKKILLGAVLLCAVSCSSDDTSHVTSGGGSNAGGSGGTTAEAGSHAGGKGNVNEAGAPGDAGADGSVGGALDSGAAGAVGAAGAGGAGVLGNAGEGGSAGDSGSAGGPSTCAAQHATVLGAVGSVSTGEVTVVTSTAGMTTLYVNATAGGTAAAGTNPWIFLAFDPSRKASVTDVTASRSTAWDLALKRSLLYTNSGEAGPGAGGSVLIAKNFEAVTAADAVGLTFATEKFFDASCATILDASGATLTTFATWYDYDPTTHVLSPHPGTWLVHSASGKLFKLRFKTYYGTATGATGTAGGAYLLDVAVL